MSLKLIHIETKAFDFGFVQIKYELSPLSSD